MERFTMPVGPYEVNCTILSDGGRAWVIDPGHEAGRIAAFLSERSLAPAGILLTHGHFDHIGAVPGLQRLFPGLPVCVGAADEPMLTHPMNQLAPDYPPIPRPAGLVRPEDFADRPDGLAVLATPGHTPGGVCYHFAAARLLLSGDTLFAGSVGRTDLPGGDAATLAASLRLLADLPGETVVVPGHGPETTIAHERRVNPFLR